MSDKIHGQHLRRKAVLYVRQSSAYQVAHNLESQKLQYGMEQRLRQLGFARTSRSSTTTWVDRPTAGRNGSGSNGWSRRSASARSGRSRLARSPGSPATAANGNNSSRSAASWTRS